MTKWTDQVKEYSKKTGIPYRTAMIELKKEKVIIEQKKSEKKKKNKNPSLTINFD